MYIIFACYLAYPLPSVLSYDLKVLGQSDAAKGVKTPRIRVTLAANIPEERRRRINPSYLDQGTIKIDEWRGRKHEGVFVVPCGGEILHPLKKKIAVAS